MIREPGYYYVLLENSDDCKPEWCIAEYRHEQFHDEEPVCKWSITGGEREWGDEDFGALKIGPKVPSYEEMCKAICLLGGKYDS